MPDAPTPEEDTRDLPRLLGTWPRMYAFVLLTLLVLIGLFYWLTRAFA